MVVRIFFLALASCIALAPPASAQELIPGVYTPGPTGFNILTLASNFNKGDVTFEPSVPIDEAHSTITGMAIGFGRTFNFAGRYANAGIGVPFVHGHIQGLVFDEFQETTRVGIGDLPVRFAVNLYGARAMTRPEFAKYRTSTIVGVGLGITIPLGQYDPSKVINIGTNRWTFRPEIGVTHRLGRWTIEGDLGMVLFTDNTNFVNGGLREQAPIATFQGHLIYTIRPGFWMAADANFWHGGRVTTNGVAATLLQHNSRVGVTVAVPVGRQQLRIGFSAGAHSRLGGDFTSIGASYSYAWTRRK